MTFELKDGEGSLFPSDYKKTDQHPSMKGKIKIAGKVMEIAAWTYKTREGKSYLSLKVQPMREPQQARKEDPKPPPDYDDPWP